MSCILSIFGEHVDVEQMLNDIPLEPDHVWKKEERQFKSKPAGCLVLTSGASFIASDAERNTFEKQLEDATEYFKNNMSLINSMANYPGVEEATLNFDIELRDETSHSHYLNPEFVASASKAGIGVEISYYPKN